MFKRILTLGDRQSFFLFGPRGTGKSTLLQRLPLLSSALRIDLLNAEEEVRFVKRPMDLERQVAALPEKTGWIIIDEVQKVPGLLDVVHRLIESTQRRFVLTGSSPRNLKRGASNLLAGQAVVHHLHPRHTRSWEINSISLITSRGGTAQTISNRWE